MSRGQVEKNPKAPGESREGRKAMARSGMWSNCLHWLGLFSFRSWPKPKSKRWWAGKWKTFAGQSEVPSKTQKAKARRRTPIHGYHSPPDLGSRAAVPELNFCVDVVFSQRVQIQTAELELRHMGNQTTLPPPVSLFTLRCYENCWPKLQNVCAMANCTNICDIYVNIYIEHGREYEYEC